MAESDDSSHAYDTSLRAYGLLVFAAEPLLLDDDGGDGASGAFIFVKVDEIHFSVVASTVHGL